MMTADVTAALELYYRDNEREARITLRFPFAISPSSLTAAADALASAIAAISDAPLVRREMKWRWREDSPQPASGDAPSQSYLALFYRNGADYDALFLPAPKAELWETAGAYAGVRLDMGNPQVSQLVESFNLALAAATGTVFSFVGAQFLAGGRAI